MSAAAAFPALFSSMKLMVELMTNKTTIPTKSCQSGGLPSPLARTIAIRAAISMTHERGFHMNPRNLRILLSWDDTNSLSPHFFSEKITNERERELDERPFFPRACSARRSGDGFLHPLGTDLLLSISAVGTPPLWGFAPDHNVKK